MAVPRKKVSHSRKNSRRSHHSLVAKQLVACPHCHQPKPSHTVCPACGYYKGKKVKEVEKAAKGA